MKVNPDHFLHQFDRIPEEKERFRALSGHAAHLLNTMNDAQERHAKKINKVIKMLRDGAASGQIILELDALLRESGNT